MKEDKIRLGLLALACPDGQKIRVTGKAKDGRRVSGVECLSWYWHS